MGMATPSGLDVTTALAVAAEAATEAGRLLLELRRKPVEILAEPGHDIKLKADQLAEERILGRLQQRLPLPVLTEESGAHDGAGPDSRMWVVDPLDGTREFIKRNDQFTVNIALVHRHEAVLGLVRRGAFFTLKPCIPSSWPGYTIDWRFGTSRYAIEVANPELRCCGVASAELDGLPVDPEAIPLLDDGREHRVRVVLGEAPDRRAGG